ncbi:MAG: hypothetical protein IID63_07825 [candidate division Zixibacteria bacterium]|nr:hypothetical protein [candidate division Zixibacteria bacterium]
MQDPARYINELGVELTGCVDPSRLAIIDSSYMQMLGFESFFFADSANMSKFLDNIFKYCSGLTDPVSKERFLPNENSPRSEFMGSTFIFASELTLGTFEKMPSMYYLPNYKMLPRDSTKEESTFRKLSSGVK